MRNILYSSFILLFFFLFLFSLVHIPVLNLVFPVAPLFPVPCTCTYLQFHYVSYFYEKESAINYYPLQEQFLGDTNSGVSWSEESAALPLLEAALFVAGILSPFSGSALLLVSMDSFLMLKKDKYRKSARDSEEFVHFL